MLNRTRGGRSSLRQVRDLGTQREVKVAPLDGTASAFVTPTRRVHRSTVGGEGDEAPWAIPELARGQGRLEDQQPIGRVRRGA